MHRSETTSNSREAARVDELVQAHPSSQWFRATLLAAVAVSGYLSIPLLSGGRILIPSFITVAMAPILLLSVWSRVTTTDIVFLLKIAFVLLISIALSPGYIYITSKLLAFAQCFAGIGVAVLTVRLMQQLGASTSERVLFLLWVMLVFGCVLEVLGIIKDYSDAFREWAYGSSFTVYGGEERDISMVGWPRPKFFSVEPSHVSKFFIVLVNAWFLIRVTWRKVWIVAAATLLMLVLMGSPMLVVSAAITLAIMLWNRNAKAGVKIGMLLATLLIAVYFGFQFGEASYSVVADRLEGIDIDPSDRSELGSGEQRTIYPYLVLIDTWSRWPFFGVGIGGKDIVFEHALVQVHDADAAMGKNVMAELGISLGLVGLAAFLYLLAGHARYTGVTRVGFMGLIFVMLSQLMGGLVTFRYWGLIAILWGAMAIADAFISKQSTLRHSL